MNNSNLLEFGGNIDLLAIAICDFETPAGKYYKNDIVLDLKDIYFTTNYVNNSKVARNSNNQLKYSEYSLSTLNFQYVPLSQQVYDLFASSSKENLLINGCEEVICLENGIIFPLSIEDIDKNSVKVKGIENIEVVKNGKNIMITSDQFSAGKSYKISYLYSKQGYVMELGNSDLNIPYFSLQISFRGNKDKDSLEGFLMIDKAHIMFTPVVNFIKDDVSYCSFSMTVIDSERKPRLVI